MKDKVNDEVTRRNFLRSAASAAALAALPGVAAIAENPGPNDAVRYGFIGRGTQGCTLLRFLTTIPAGRCIATCDIYPPNLKKGVQTIGSKPYTSENYRPRLDSKAIAADLIRTPI